MLRNLLVVLIVVTAGLGAVPATVRADGCAAAPEVDPADEGATVQRLRRMYVDGRYAALDAVLDCLAGSSARFRSGRTGAGVAFQVLRQQLPGPPVEQVEFERVRRWLDERPTSVFAEFAALRLMYVEAWQLRGMKPDALTPDEARAVFQQRLEQAEGALRHAAPALGATPIWHSLMFAIALDARRPGTDPAAIFAQAVRRWPRHYDFYEAALSRMVPRWGGSWSVVDSAIRRWTARLAASEGESLYARLYASVFAGEGEDPHASRIDWRRLRRGFDDLVRRYPDPLHVNAAASFACLHRDAAWYRAALARVDPSDVRRDAWVGGTSPEACAPLLAATRP
ncbi:MAG TPA: hypothetical protein PK072_12885 [Quisquiliibacterium sp.]|nr:hypothetical protein [Quisquiliibacterium sp.]HQP67534.1 hypothetical protein [Quisquiliibacterium sp.]